MHRGILPNLIHSYESDILREIYKKYKDKVGMTIHDAFILSNSITESDFNNTYNGYLEKLPKIFEIQIDYQRIKNDYADNKEAIESLKGIQIEEYDDKEEILEYYLHSNKDKLDRVKINKKETIEYFVKVTHEYLSTLPLKQSKIPVILPIIVNYDSYIKMIDKEVIELELDKL